MRVRLFSIMLAVTLVARLHRRRAIPVARSVCLNRLQSLAGD